MNMPTFQVPISESLKKLVEDYDLHYDEVVEIWKIEDDILFILALIDQNEIFKKIICAFRILPLTLVQ